MSDKPQPMSLTEDDMHDMPTEGKSIVSRWSMGSSPTEHETEYMANLIRGKMPRPMMDSMPLERAMLKIKSGK